MEQCENCNTAQTATTKNLPNWEHSHLSMWGKFKTFRCFQFRPFLRNEMMKNVQGTYSITGQSLVPFHIFCNTPILHNKMKHLRGVTVQSRGWEKQIEPFSGFGHTTKPNLPQATASSPPLHWTSYSSLQQCLLNFLLFLYSRTHSSTHQSANTHPLFLKTVSSSITAPISSAQTTCYYRTVPISHQT